MRERFEGFASRFAEKARAGLRSRPRRGHPTDEDYWASVEDLFTRDVTEKELRSLVEYEAQATLRYFTRDVDLTAFQARPWYKRYPLMAWKVFLATAFRLSPARRILFALAVPLLWLAWVRYLLSGLGGSAWALPTVFGWLLFSATMLGLLLALELRDKLTLKGDLEVARQIQFGLLPFEPYDRDGASIRAAMRPANTVGGDYFDIIDLGQSRVAVVMGDVAGKGMPAALLMALLQGSLRTLISAGFRGPELLEKLNAHLHANIPSNRLITLFYGEFDGKSGRLLYVNAGHNAPFVLRQGGLIERLPATAMALGVVKETPFEVRQVCLEKGDRALLFTDGITEAFDPPEREYGEDRLAAFLGGHLALGDEDLLEGVRADVESFCGGAPARDDMTLLVLSRLANQGEGGFEPVKC